MKKLLRKPVTNAVCISLFTSFYSLIFIVTSGHMEFDSLLYYNRVTRRGESFWYAWCDFLAAGHHADIAYALIALTFAVVILLLTRRRPYDEYHVGQLVTCLVVAMFLTLIAIALFYFAILSESAGIVEKFTLFIVIHWATVVLADLVYVFVCRWK